MTFGRISRWRLENWELPLFLIISAVAIILNTFDLMTEKTTMQILLLLIMAYTLYQIAENKKVAENIAKIEHLGPHINGRRVTQRECYVLLKRSIQQAEKTVDLTHIEANPPQSAGIKEKDEYFSAVKKVIKSKNVRVRRIVTIPNMKKLEWVKGLINEFKDCPNFNVHYTDMDCYNFCVPPLSLQIVDSRDVLIIDMTKGYHTATEEDVDLWISDEEIAQPYQQYYEQYWKTTMKIKEGNMIYLDNLQKIEDKIKERSGSR